LDTTIDQWGRGRAPRQYVRKIIDSADKALTGQARTLEKVPASDTRRDEMQRSLSELRRRIGGLSAAVERNDPDGARATTQGRGK
jgi:hypothetical protein